MIHAFLSFLICIGLAVPALAETRGEVRQTTRELLKARKYRELEALVARLRAEPFAVTERNPKLEAFYGALDLSSKASEKSWLARGKELEAWGVAVPDSVAAKTLLADWWTGYAWKARGTGWARTVTDEGWRLMKERLAKAEAVLREVPFEQANDPAYFAKWLTVGLGQGWSYAKARRYFNYGVKVNPNYHPLYRNFVYWLAPRWHGEEGDWQAFAREAATTFPQETGDWLYVQLVGSRVEDFPRNNLITEGGLDPDRVGRAISAAGRDPRSVPDDWTRNVVCYLAALKGEPLAAQLFLEIEGGTFRTVFNGKANLLRLRKESGAQKRIDAAFALERKGDLEAAEAAFASFNPNREKNGWLRAFYLRQGKEALYRETGGESSLLDADPATAPISHTSAMARLDLMLHRWDRAETAARRFDQERPWNVLGKTTLLLLATRTPDPAEVQRLKEAILAVESKRPAFQTFQSVVRGEKAWDEAWATLRDPKDEYGPQTVVAVAAWYAANGRKAEARTALEALVAEEPADVPMVEFSRSLLFGSLASLLAGGS